MDFVEGEILSFDKPLHWTSFDLVAKVRRTLCHALGVKKLKVGHRKTYKNDSKWLLNNRKITDEDRVITHPIFMRFMGVFNIPLSRCT